MNKIDWTELEINDNDLDLIYNCLLENETPMTPLQLAEKVIEDRIRTYTKNQSKNPKENNAFYRPRNDYKEGEVIEFPLLNNSKGNVVSVRPGVNPVIGDFSVITVKMEDGSTREFAAGLSSHHLNEIDYDNPDPRMLDAKYVHKKFGRQISKKVAAVLAKNEDLARIGSFWFPLALLSEVNPGYLNLAEAVLEMEEGRPLPPEEILEQIDYPVDSNSELTVFSFNYAMYRDERFAEVGPVNVVLWTLKDMQPEDVRKVPMTLKFNKDLYDFDQDLPESMDFAAMNMMDELDTEQLVEPEEANESHKVCISYPHWKAGTLPLTGAVRSIFPTANETDNVVFTFRDIKSGETFQGWVIISKNYVCGLKQWYRNNGLIPGSIFRVSKSDISGYVDIELIPPRASKDWIRSIQVDAKNHFTFRTNQHKITTDFDERLVIYVENSPQLDTFWEANNRKESNIIRQIELVFRELSQDNPQGIIHFSEIYAGINMLRRIPPRLLYTILLREESIRQFDKMYFKLIEKDED